MGGFDKQLARKANLKQGEIRAVVLKACKCGEPATGWEHCPKCGTPVVKIDKGVVAYYHRRWYKRLWFWICKKLGWSHEGIVQGR